MTQDIMSPQGFKFTWLCELLDTLDAARKEKCLTSNRNVNLDVNYTTEWFIKYNGVIPRHGAAAVAFLSCLLPERLPKRSYSMQEAALANVWARIRRLPARSVKSLKAWKSAETDLANTIEQVFADFDDNIDVYNGPVTLEEIDRTLFQLAANSAFSSPEMRQYKNSQSQSDILAPIVRRLRSSEAKWFVRMILKRYTPVQLPERTVLRSFHFLLPHIMVVRNSIESAIDVLSLKELQGIPANPSLADESWILRLCAHYIVPGIGSMITRTPFVKARTIKHCCNEARGRMMSVERKYDGEYCQVHIDLTKEPSSQIQIFSKSGKDSTRDRIRLHPALRKGLRFGEPECAFSRNCIVEGELLVYDRSTRSILPFHTIRKHILHGGKPLGTDMDSPRKPDEQLLFVFYDILFLDDMVLSQRPHQERRKRLEHIVRHVEGESQVAFRQVINFSNSGARRGLLDIFAHAIQHRWEGLVLKGCDDPYFSFLHSQSVIKLKKDYIKGCGDVVDLCIIGGRRDPSIVEELQLGPFSWTTFYIACLENKEEVRRFNAKPIFRILQTVSFHGVPKEDMLHLNAQGQRLRVPFANLIDHYTVWPDATEMKSMKAPSELFKVPFVVEIMGAGFERPQDARYMVPRFPRVIKVHSDRSFMETGSFEEVQKQAEQSMEGISVQEIQEETDWIARLIAADGKEAPRFHSVSETTASPSASNLSNSLNKLAQAVDTPCKIRPASNKDGTLQNTERNTLYFESKAVSPEFVMTSRPCQRRITNPDANAILFGGSTASDKIGRECETSSSSSAIALRDGEFVRSAKRKLADVEHFDENKQTARHEKQFSTVENISSTRFFGSSEALNTDTVSYLRHHTSLFVQSVQSSTFIFADTVRPHTSPGVGSPIHPMSTLRSFPKYIRPFEPPAVFRPPSSGHRARRSLVSQSTVITPPKSRQRRPLSDLSAGSPQRGRDELPVKLTRTISDKENPETLSSSGKQSAENATANSAMGSSTHNNHKRVAEAASKKHGVSHAIEQERKPPNHAPRKEIDGNTFSKSQPSVQMRQLSIDDFAKYVLCSHWPPVEKEHAFRNGFIPRPCRQGELLMGRLLLARVLDCSEPEDIAKEIYRVAKTVSVLRSRLMRGSSSSPSRPNSSCPRERKQQKLVIFYGTQALPLMPTENIPCKCDDSQLCQSCLRLVNSQLRYHFKGAVLFSTGGGFCPPETLHKSGEGSGRAGPGLYGNGTKDKLVADVITNWRHLMGLLQSLHCEDGVV
ncbi:hypothetical protein RBB50_002036 [Rhinocladiella similis]